MERFSLQPYQSNFRQNLPSSRQEPIRTLLWWLYCLARWNKLSHRRQNQRSSKQSRGPLPWKNTSIWMIKSRLELQLNHKAMTPLRSQKLWNQSWRTVKRNQKSKRRSSSKLNKLMIAQLPQAQTIQIKNLLTPKKSSLSHLDQQGGQRHNLRTHIWWMTTRSQIFLKLCGSGLSIE